MDPTSYDAIGWAHFEMNSRIRNLLGDHDRLRPSFRQFMFSEAHGCPIKSSLDTLYAHAQRLRTKMAKHGLGAAAFADVDHYLKE